MLDCDEGGPRVTPKATSCGSVLVTPVDREGHPLQMSMTLPPPAHPGGILKRLTALLAILPGRLGRQAAAGSLSVATASDELGTPSATVTTIEDGRWAHVLAQPNARRRRFYILNDHDCEPLRVKFGLGCNPDSATLVVRPGTFYDSKSYPTYTGVITVYGRRVKCSVTEVLD